MKTKQPRTRENQMSIRTTDAEAAKFASAAALSGLSVSSWARTRLIETAAAELREGKP